MASQHRLIASSRVEGTTVFSSDGKKLGEIDHLMIDKPTGFIAYAVIRFTGEMVRDGKYHPLPWSVLKYDTALDGYRTRVSEAKVLAAPDYDPNGLHELDEVQRLHNHYDVPFYWKSDSPISM